MSIIVYHIIWPRGVNNEFQLIELLLSASLLQFVYLGIVTSIESNHKQVDSARKGQEVCIKIENVPGETPKLYGRHFDETDMLISKVSTPPGTGLGWVHLPRFRGQGLSKPCGQRGRGIS